MKNASAQSWAFKSTAAVLNAGSNELKSWKIYIGFQHGEILVSAGGAIVVDGDGFPTRVGNESYLVGYPQTGSKTAIDTAGDFTQIQANIEMTGTQFGVKPSGTPMPKTIKLVNEGYKCPAPKRHKTEMHVCYAKDPKFKSKKTRTKFLPRHTCACGCDNTARCNPNARAMVLPPEALLVPFDNRTAKAKAWASIKHLKIPSPLPCPDNRGVSINWHIDSDYKSGWTARIPLLNWDEFSFEDLFTAIQMKKTYSGYENVYSFNGSKAAAAQ
ncbi:hypothetical protein F0562_008823 [Nyssa sinensis]|uniref:COBRA C-terminal domain-containing protein n=1 Tax=Nyssa sinensis TaxID=561372 RepID=A0A5J5AA90_9ASTE|nr:hypothetical protein F0562_008823 [Nyssa sinensis]